MLVLKVSCCGIMQVQLVVDGTPSGKPIVGSVHRTIAGDHGFVLEFPCSLATGEGQRKFAAEARVNATATVYFEVGEKCSLDGEPAAC